LISRILIIGLGSIGKRHLRIARTLHPSADIRVLRHQESLLIPEYADGIFSRMEHALAFAPELAVIASPATRHISAALPLADAGVHLLIEKPLSASPEGVSTLLETSHKRGVVLTVGYNLRFSPSLQRFRDLLRKGVIGRVLSFRCETGQYLPFWRPATDYRYSVSALRELGGGVLLELSHELDYLRWLFGEVDWVRATLGRQSTLEINVEDTAHLILGFMPAADESRLIGTLNMDFVRHDTTRMCTVIGEKGSLRWNGLTGLVEQFKDSEHGWTKLFEYQQQQGDSYLAEWHHFLNCINGSVTPMITGEDALHVLDIIEAARRSSVSGLQVLIKKSETSLK